MNGRSSAQYLADGLFIAFGIAAFILPFFLVEYGVGFLRRREFTRWTKPLSSGILFFVSLGLLEIVRLNTALLADTTRAGGLLGHVIGKALFTYFSWGSVVLLLMLLCAGVMIGYDVFAPYQGLKDLLSTMRENRRLKRKQREMEKPPRQKAAKKPQEERAAAPPEAAVAPSGKKEPQITISGSKEKAVSEVPLQATLDFVGDYQRPPLSLLSNPPAKSRVITEKELKANASLIVSKLKQFAVEGEILEIKPGPVITMFEFTPAPESKINRSCPGRRPGHGRSRPRRCAVASERNAVGIEIPNRPRDGSRRRLSADFVIVQRTVDPGPGQHIEGTPSGDQTGRSPFAIAGARARAERRV